MPDRFDKFTEEELHELRYGLTRGARDNTWAGRTEAVIVCERLEAEIEHLQVQREHRAARERVVA